MLRTQYPSHCATTATKIPHGFSLAMETGESSSTSGADGPGLESDDEQDSQRRASTCSTEPLLADEDLQSPQLPGFLSRLSLEERRALETKLKRKIDARLMPALIVMYILNYIDR